MHGDPNSVTPFLGMQILLQQRCLAIGFCRAKFDIKFGFCRRKLAGSFELCLAGTYAASGRLRAERHLTLKARLSGHCSPGSGTIVHLHQVTLPLRHRTKTYPYLTSQSSSMPLRWLPMPTSGLLAEKGMHSGQVGSGHGEARHRKLWLLAGVELARSVCVCMFFLSPENVKGWGPKRGGGWAKPHEETPTPHRKPRYVLPPLLGHFSKNGFQGAILVRFCSSVRFATPSTIKPCPVKNQQGDFCRRKFLVDIKVQV